MLFWSLLAVYLWIGVVLTHAFAFGIEERPTPRLYVLLAPSWAAWVPVVTFVLAWENARDSG